MTQRLRTPSNARPGFTLVEMLIAVSLMSFVALSVVLALTRVNTTGSSLSQRNRAVLEIQSVFNNMHDAITNSSGVSKFSVSSKIILHNTDSSGNVYLQAYRILSQNLEVSSNLQDAAETGATWNSPYNIASASSYKITSGEFLYCGYGPNNCYRFPDGNGNRRWDGAGTDGAIAWVSLNASAQGTALTSPEQARKVVLYNFTFDRQFGNPAVKRTMPNIAIRLGGKLVDAGGPNVAWTSANPLVQSFVTHPSTLASTNFREVRGIAYDNSRRRLAMVGGNFAGGATHVFALSRDGVNIRDNSNGISSPVSFTMVDVHEVAWEDDGIHVLILDSDSGGTCAIYRYNLKTGSIEQNHSLSATIQGTSASAIAYDPSTPTDFYLIGNNTSGSRRLFRFNKTTGASVATGGFPMALPAGLTAPTSMFMDPITGYFYVLNNTVTVSGGESLLTIYKIDRNNSTATDTFQISLTKIGALTTAIERSIAYDFAANNMFLSQSDTTTMNNAIGTNNNKIFEFNPPKIISPRN